MHRHNTVRARSSATALPAFQNTVKHAGSQLLYTFFGTQILQELFVLQFVFFLFAHIVLLVLITNAE